MNDREKDRREVLKGLPAVVGGLLQKEVMLARVVGRDFNRWLVVIYGKSFSCGGVRFHRDYRKVCREPSQGVIYPVHPEVGAYLKARRAFGNLV